MTNRGRSPHRAGGVHLRWRLIDESRVEQVQDALTLDRIQRAGRATDRATPIQRGPSVSLFCRLARLVDPGKPSLAVLALSRVAHTWSVPARLAADLADVVQVAAHDTGVVLVTPHVRLVSGNIRGARRAWAPGMVLPSQIQEAPRAAHDLRPPAHFLVQTRLHTHRGERARRHRRGQPPRRSAARKHPRAAKFPPDQRMTIGVRRTSGSVRVSHRELSA